MGTPVLIPFVESTRLVCERSMTGATGNLYCGLHEFGDMGFLLHFLRPGDLFVDVGANIGSFSMLASGVVGAKSVAIEPVPSSFAALRRNIAVNGLEDMVEPLCVAAGPRSGRVRLSMDRGPENAPVGESYPGASAEFPMVSLDEVTENKCPVLLKVDAEGAEREVLEGASESLRNPTLKAVLLEGASGAIAGMMSRAGFAPACYAPMTRRLEVTESERRGSVWETLNFLWVRDEEFVRDRCSAARLFTVYGQSF